MAAQGCGGAGRHATVLSAFYAPCAPPCRPAQDASYQAWFDEAAHPLRKQRQRPGGLEAAWAAVLGSGSGASLVRQQLPRSLLEAASSMPWDAAAAACLRLLRALLAPAAEEQGKQGQQDLLQHAFSAPLRAAGARAAQRALVISGAAVLACLLSAAAGCRSLAAAGFVHPA